MVEEIDDPAHEVVQKSSRVMMMAASMVAERVARERQRRQQEAADAKGAEAALLRARLDSQKAAARAELRAADAQWFDRASARETADLWQSAEVWNRVEPETFGAEQARIGQEIERRYDVDLGGVDQEGRDLAEELRARADAELVHEREANREAILDETGAGVQVAGAGQDAARDRAATERRDANRSGSMAADLDAQAGDVDYDSDAHRDALADRARQGGADEPTVEARVRASSANGRPSRQAATPRKRPRTSTRPKVAQPSKGAQIQR